MNNSSEILQRADRNKYNSFTKGRELFSLIPDSVLTFEYVYGI